MSNGEEYAAVDLGSNRFHLITARLVDEEVVIIDKIKERVRLAAGLRKDMTLSPESQKRALDCLELFGHRLAHIKASNIRVVGTNTLRKSKKSQDFISKAEAALGRRIEVISGLEEARLIHVGVTHFLPSSTHRHLVIDIGGGSTECVVGEGDSILKAHSFYMGCVEYTTRYFNKPKWTHKDFEKAVTAARLQISPIQRQYRELEWSEVYGSSGTINAIGEILQANHFGSQITRSGIDWLFGYVQGAKSIEGLELDDLKPDRAPVFVGGVCILWSLFNAFKIETLTPVSTALREGVLCEVAQLSKVSDLRDQSVQRFMKRFAVDEAHAHRVCTVIDIIGPSLLKEWELNQSSYLQLLHWSAQLHEIGKSIQYTGYHKHSAYLVNHGYLAGFSKQEQSTMAALLACHRRKLSPSKIEAILGRSSDEIIKLVVILRLAVLMCRTRSKRPRPQVVAHATEQGVHLCFPKEYFKSRPLTFADLEQECELLKNVGIKLTFEN